MRAAIRENRDFRSGKRALVTALDISKAHKVLGWLPQIDLRDGLRETVRWYLAKS